MISSGSETDAGRLTGVALYQAPTGAACASVAGWDGVCRLGHMTRSLLSTSCVQCVARGIAL